MFYLLAYACVHEEENRIHETTVNPDFESASWRLM